MIQNAQVSGHDLVFKNGAARNVNAVAVIRYDDHSSAQ